MFAGSTISSSINATGSQRINCLLVAGVDPLTQNLRTGAALRYFNPPENVSYRLRIEKLAYPEYLGHYGLAPLSVPLSAAKLVAEYLFPLKDKSCSLIHSFFWSIHRYSLPWIHENDQSLGQYLSEYVNFKGSLMTKITNFSTSLLNAEKCVGIIVWSEWAKNGYIRDGVDRNKIRVIPPAFRTTSNRKEHKKVNILFLGRDYYRKGGNTVLKVFDDLRKSFESVHLIFIGKIPDGETLQKVKGDKKISYYEHVSTEFLHEEIFPITDIFLLPTKAEAYGMSLVEAMSNGIPIVSSEISAIPEIIQHSITGYLCQPLDVQGYVKRCAMLVENMEKRLIIGNNAKTFVSTKFSPKIIGRELHDFYSEKLN